MLPHRLLRTLVASLAVASLSLLVAPRSALAGCGCDHPPPAFAPVMPPFASPGKEVRLWAAANDAFVPGALYQVRFGGSKVRVAAVATTHLRVAVPEGLRPGPLEIRVQGPGVDSRYDETLFTALPPPVAVPGEDGVFVSSRLQVAVDANGTVLLPVDLSQVRDATQFAFVFQDLPLDFDEEDVVLYNADGVDLSIFSLVVDDPTKRQWGSYYGWQIEEDAGLSGLVFDPKVAKRAQRKERKERKREKRAAQQRSDVFTYWRHEFHTYAAAHAPGGSHELDAEGLHPDGSLHIDHDRLVIAIAGELLPAKKRHKAHKRGKALASGFEQADLALLTVRTERPIDAEHVADALEGVAPRFLVAGLED